MATEYAGTQFVAATAPTLAAAETFAGVLAAHSDCGLVKVELGAFSLLNNAPDGPNSRRLHGTTILQRISTLQRFPLTVPGISGEDIQLNVGGPDSLLPATTEAVRAAFVTFTGFADADVIVAASQVTETRYRSRR